MTKSNFGCLKMSISSSYSKNVFVGQRTLSWQFFSFHAFEILCYCFLASTVSAKKPAARVSVAPWKAICLFSLAAFKIFLFVFAFINFAMIYLDMSFFLFIFLEFIGLLEFADRGYLSGRKI